MPRRGIHTLLLLGGLLASCTGPGNRDADGQGLEEFDCMPTTCALEGKDCGTLLDGCGATIECGSCGGGDTCGGGGVANVCGAGSCTPRTTCEAGQDCGEIQDGCAGILSCGATCPTGEFCGGSGTPNVCGADSLAVATGCAGPFNPGQLLELHLTMAAGDWSALKANLTNDLVFVADFACGSEALPFKVGVRRKRSGSLVKPGIKIDFNFVQVGGEWQSLKKLSLENGISEGGTEASIRDLVGEYLGWRMMNLGGTMSSRASFVRLTVNGAVIGTYVNVEQVDKRFLRSRLGDDTGWLFKLSGSAGDGYKTNATVANPYESLLCFLDKNPCAAPTPEQLATWLPAHLDVPQMLRFGGVNAVIANADAPFVKENNFYWYDYAPGGAHQRVYFPWDLDTTMKNATPLFGAPGTTVYTDVLFTHWEDDYDALLTGLLAGPLALGAIDAELDQAEAVAGAALDADPTITAGDTTAGAVVELKGYWATRHPALVSELESHLP